MGVISQHLEHLLEQVDGPLWGGYVNMLKTLESVFQSPKHWILEFLQNAEDASSRVFEIRLNDASVEVLNNGHVFTEPDFHTVCDVNSRKLPSLGLRGYIGIGFKSIFRITDYVEIHSGQFHFAFDRSHWGEYVQRNNLPFSKWPWEILPVEIADRGLPSGFKTAFRVPLETTNGQAVLSEISDYLTNGLPKEIVLLVKNVKTIRITAPDCHVSIGRAPKLSEQIAIGHKDIATIEKRVAGEAADKTDYLVFSTTVPVDEDVRQDPDTERVRRSEITQRDIGLVFPLDTEGNIITSLGTLGGVYSFLPIEGEQTGLPFGIFGDFIPSPGRDQINYGAKWNQWMCRRILEFFGKVVEKELLILPSWRCFPAQAYDELKRASRGGPFWNEALRQPILDLLGNLPIFLDREMELHTLDELFVTSEDIKGIFTDDQLEKATGRKSPHPTMLGLKVMQPGSTTEVGMLYVLRSETLLQSIKNDIAKLLHLYHQIQSLTDYYIKGRPQGRGTRDIPLRRIPFVLGDDNEFHAPERVKLLQKVDKIPSFFPIQDAHHKCLLHTAIAKDPTAVEQLKRCGMEVIGLEETISAMKSAVNDMANKQIGSPELYESFIEATLWLAAHSRITMPKVVAEDGTLQLPSDVFVPGAYLNWLPLWEAYLLPGYFPIDSRYSKLAPKYGVQLEQLHQCLEQEGVHGFSKEGDQRLLSIAGEEIARKRLTANGHDPVRVADHDKLGYDLMCQGHCGRVFEVKGMSEPADVALQASQVDRAKEYGENYVLVCVYNLPNDPSGVGYKEIPDPGRIWTPEEKAKVPKRKWLRDSVG